MPLTECYKRKLYLYENEFICLHATQLEQLQLLRLSIE